MLRRLQQERDYILTEGAITLLRQQDYPGNVRELRNILARALVLANTNVIDHHVIGRCLDIDRSERSWSTALAQPLEQASGSATALPAGQHAGGGHWARDLPADLKQQELRYLRQLLQDCGGDKARAAAQAGISVRSLYRKLQQARQRK
jgi:DNA-binding NtrC family response regulator